MPQKLSIEALEAKAHIIREKSTRLLKRAGSGYAAGLADIFAGLYFDVMKHDPKNPDWEGRDLLVVSDDNDRPVHAVAMAEAGYLERTELSGLEMTRGLLGSGLGQAAGMAMGLRLNEQKNRWVYVIMSDLEHNLGTVWEAALFASTYHSSNLIAITACSSVQIDGLTKAAMSPDNLKAKWQAFGWRVLEMDGNNMDMVLDTLYMAKAVSDKPVMIIAVTAPDHDAGSVESNDQVRSGLLKTGLLPHKLGMPDGRAGRVHG